MTTQSTAKHHALAILSLTWTAEGATHANLGYIGYCRTPHPRRPEPCPDASDAGPFKYRDAIAGERCHDPQHSIIDVEDLESSLRAKIDSLLENAKPEDLKSLRDSIDATPQAVSALKAKGRVSAQVVAINVDDNGILTMFTKKSA